jgi:hypothetical protein
MRCVAFGIQTQWLAVCWLHVLPQCNLDHGAVRCKVGSIAP